MVKAIIFDLDGLIIDSEPIESESLRILLESYGKTPVYNKSGLIHVAGEAGNTYNILKEKYELAEEVKVLRRRKRRIYTSLLKKQLAAFNGVAELMTLLKKHSIKVGLASNRNTKHIRLILKQLGLVNGFDAVIGPTARRKHKPSPDIYLAAAKKLRVDPKECLVLEDSATGVLAGKAAGMKVIAVPNQYTKQQDLSKADKIVESLNKVNWKLIKQL